MKDLRRLSGEDPEFPGIIFFHMGTVAEGDAFFESLWPEARAVADPDRTFYDAFGRKSVSVWRLLGPRSWLPALRAMLKGSGIGKPVGDIHVMPGAFLVRGDEVLWQHDYEGGTGDHPDWKAVAARARAERAGT